VSREASQHLPGLIAHELRNPLASAMTGAMLAREMVDGEDPRAPVLDGVLRDLDRLTRLLDGWLRVARAANTVGETIEVDLLVADAAARGGVQVVSRSPGTCIAGDRDLLARSFDNLFENARKAGAGSIRIAVQTLPGEVEIHVEDDGRGIARADAERVFEAGWSGSGGAGLGLFAVASTVEAHGGRVRCQPLVRGTRFSITLPLAEHGAAHA
jgi:signal transduction histidine kinase